jgi:ferredoxin-NADP reductase
MRQFTLSSSPTEQLPTCTVRFPDVGSSFKRWLQDLKPGDPILVSDPLGDFVLPRVPSVPLVWIAGGIGVTPFRSQAMWLMSEDDHRDITFYHRTGDDTRLWRDVFADAAIVPADYTTQASLLSDLRAKPEALYYIAGSPVFIENVRTQLSKKDVHADQMVTDAFLGY